MFFLMSSHYLSLFVLFHHSRATTNRRTGKPFTPLFGHKQLLTRPPPITSLFAHAPTASNCHQPPTYHLITTSTDPCPSVWLTMTAHLPCHDDNNCTSTYLPPRAKVLPPLFCVETTPTVHSSTCHIAATSTALVLH